jgi:hypothetical protein
MKGPAAAKRVELIQEMIVCARENAQLGVEAQVLTGASPMQRPCARGVSEPNEHMRLEQESNKCRTNLSEIARRERAARLLQRRSRIGDYIADAIAAP